MKTLFLSLAFVLSFIVCSGQDAPPPGTQRGFIVVFLDGQELQVEPINSVDFKIATAAGSVGGRTRPAPGTTPLSTEILLTRSYDRRSDWKEWITRYQSDPRTKECELKTVDQYGRMEELVRQAEAAPIHYQLDSGFEVLTIKVSNIQF